MLPNTELITFREGMWVLTEQALLNNGLDIRSRLAGAQSPEIAIDGFLVTVSDIIYNFIHEFNHDNNAQDQILENVIGARDILYRALVQQAVFMAAVGDKSLEEKNPVSYHAQRTLNRTIPELGCPITYAGFWRGL